MRIGIVGTGTAGPAAAALLAQDGHDVTLYERAHEIRPVGAGLLLQPTGMHVLERLGVLDSLLKLGSPVHRLLGVNELGRTVLDCRYADLRPGLFGLGVHRAALLEALINAALARGVVLLTGVRACSISRDHHSRVSFVDHAGTTHGPFDLLLACDGARSALRDDSGLVRKNRAYPWGALWFVALDPDGRYDGTLAQTYRGTAEMIGILPTGRAAPSAPASVSLFWSLRLDRFDALVRGGLEAWKDRARTLRPDTGPILDQINNIDQLIPARYHDVVMRSMIDRRVVYLGDAHHAMSPQLGQGANLALMDAGVLADVLDGVCIADATLDMRLKELDARRARSVRYYQWASRWLTPVFQSDAHWLTPFRDTLMGPLCRVGPVRRAMLQSLAGVKTGVLPWQADPLPAQMRA